VDVFIYSCVGCVYLWLQYSPYGYGGYGGYGGDVYYNTPVVSTPHPVALPRLPVPAPVPALPALPAPAADPVTAAAVATSAAAYGGWPYLRPYQPPAARPVFPRAYYPSYAPAYGGAVY